MLEKLPHCSQGQFCPLPWFTDPPIIYSFILMFFYVFGAFTAQGWAKATSPVRGEIHAPPAQVTSRGAWKSLTFEEQMEGKQKCRICGKYGLKFWNFGSDCSEGFQSEAVTPTKHLNKPSVWHSHLKKPQTQTHPGVSTLYLIFYLVQLPPSWRRENCNILGRFASPGELWRACPVVRDSCATQARRAALTNPAGRFP